MKKVGIYIRVSTREQANEGYSIGVQKSRLKDYCKAKQWDVFNIYEDGGFSGGNIERPALAKLIEDAKHKRFDIVLVMKLDRLSRSQKDTLYLIEDVFLASKVDFVSMNENFDTTTAFGRAMIGILSVFAQLEREQIKERMTMGMEERAKEGLYHGGGNYSPIGYDYIDGKLIVNDYEAKQIRELFNLYLKGYGIRKIQEILHSRYGRWTSMTTVKNAISKQLYIGNIVHHDNIYEGQHDSIIDTETFFKAQKLAERKHKKSIKMRDKSKHKPSLLTGMIWCSHCGARYFRHQQIYVYKDKREPRYWYQCYSRHGSAKNMVKDKNCKNKNYKQEKLEKVVFDQIILLAKDDCLFEQKLNKNQTPNHHKSINKIDKQIKRLLDLYQLSSVDFEEVDSRINKLNNEKEIFIDEMKQNDKIPANEAKEILNGAQKIIEGKDTKKKRMLLESLIDYIQIDNEDIHIHFNF